MTRRRRLLALLVALLGFIAFGLSLPALTGRLIVSRLSAAFERHVELGHVRFFLSPLRVEMTGLKVGGYSPDSPPFLAVPRIVVTPGIASLWTPSPGLSRLRLEGLTIRVNAFPEGGDDIPRPKRKGGGGQLHVGHVSIAGGAFFLNHARVPLEMELPNFQGGLAGRGPGILAGNVSFGPGSLAYSTGAPLPVELDLDLLVDGSMVTVEAGRVTAEGADLACRGQIRIAADPVGEFAIDGPVDLEVLDRHVMLTDLGIKGAGNYQGTLFVDGPRLSIKGRLYGTGGEFDGVAVSTFDGGLDWDQQGVHIRDLEVEALGGSGIMNSEVPPGDATATWSGSVEGGDAEGMLRAIFDIGPFGLGGAATGEFALEWPKGRFSEALSGRLRMDIAPRDDGREPLWGFLEWSALDGVQQIESSDLRTPSTQGRFVGQIDVEDRIDGTLDGESRDIAGSDALGMRMRRALGTPEAYLAGFTGSGVFRGRVRGTLDVPVFEGRVSGKDIGWLGVVWGRAEWVGVADAYVVHSHSLVVRRPGGELWVDGWAETGYYGEDDRIEIKARFDAWPASDFISALEWDLELTGPVSGEAVVRGRRSYPEGSAQVGGPKGLYYGIPYTALDVDSAFEGAVGWGSGRATVGGGAVEFRGSLTDDGFFDGIAEATDVDVTDVLPAPSQAVAWGGRVSGQATLQGALARPRVVGQLSSKRIFLGDEGLGAVEATLRGDGDGAVSVAARCSSPRVDLALDGTVGTMPPYPVSLEIAAQDTSLDPFLRVAYPKLHSALGVVVSGRLRLQGDASSPQSLEVNGQVSDFQLLLPDYPVRSQGPADLLVHDGRLALGRLQLSGEGTDLTLHGVAALLEDGPLELTLRGAADLRALSAVTRRLRGRGDARLSLDVKGTRDAPRIAGTLELEGAGIRARGFPHGIEGVRGNVRFTEAAAEFSEITGTIGGGAVELGGQATYEGGQLGTFEVQATGRGMSLRYPEGLRSQIDADIRLFGNAEQQWVAGNVDVLQASWTRRYDLASEILSPREMLPERASLEEGLRYDISVSAPGTLRIDNNLATLQARAELRLQGTYAHPVILGRAEVERGRVYFQGNTYVMRRGVIDFANPQEIDPLFDIEAETRLRSYRVTLRMNGTLERVSPTLSSDPPLSAVQILSLLAGADEADVASLMQVRTDQANLAATGAATLAAGRISEEVGLERGAERLFGLNRFSIDPSIIKGGVSNPTARLTVGKRLTPDLNVLYSIDLRGTEQRVLSVEYSLSDRFSLLITQNENPSETAVDLRLIRSY